MYCEVKFDNVWRRIDDLDRKRKHSEEYGTEENGIDGNRGTGGEADRVAVCANARVSHEGASITDTSVVHDEVSWVLTVLDDVLGSNNA